MHTKKELEIQNAIYDLTMIVIGKLKINSQGFQKIYHDSIYINAFITRLKTGSTWKQLEYQFKISDTHLNRIFNLWCDMNVFKDVFELFLKQYKCYIENEEAFIDSTILINKFGYRDTTGINTYEARKHRSNKLSCIVSKNGIPLGIKLTNSQVHDVKLLLDTLPKKTYFTTLIGDKGYISKKLKAKLKRNRRINLITGYRKNQKEKQNIDTKSRITIEHFNSLLKQNRGINIRYDKNIEPYEGLIYLGCIYRGLQVVFKFLYDL